MKSPLLFVALAAFAFSATAADAPFEQTAFKRMLAAVQAQSLSEFTALGDAAFKAMPLAEFEKATARFSPMLKAGHSTTYLGEFKQAGMRVHYWKLEFTGEKNDWVAKLATDGNKVKGFFFTPP